MKKKAVSRVVKTGRRSVPAGSRITLAQVARHAGVHAATASQILNDRSNCWASETTRQRVFDAARQLGYRPNLSARALRLGRSRVIGLVSPGFCAGFSNTRAAGLTEAAAKADYTVALSSHPNDSASEDKVIRHLIDNGVDGLAIYPVDSGPHTELRRLVDNGFPVVTFDGRSLLDFDCDDISVDYEAVGRKQARHLLALGCKRICLANTIPEARIMAIRERAVREEIARAGVSPPLEMRLPGSATREFVEAKTLASPMLQFLKKHGAEIDGVIGNDQASTLALQFLRRMGLRIPGDVAVIGSGTTMLATYGEVPLTSVTAATASAGVKAFDLLVARIEGRAGEGFRRLTTPAKLFVRQSTAIKSVVGRKGNISVYEKVEE